MGRTAGAVLVGAGFAFLGERYPVVAVMPGREADVRSRRVAVHGLAADGAD